MNFDFLEKYNFSSQTKIAAVIGDPVAQSLSPHMHNYLLKKHKIDGIYIPLKVPAVDFSKFLKTLPNLGFSGCNITIPHKETALTICDKLSSSAKKIGAVNTIVFNEEGKIFGDNSDYYGFVANIKNTHPNFNFNDKKILLLGAGGAARAIIFGLLAEGVKEIIICNRNQKRAKDLENHYCSANNITSSIKVMQWSQKDKNLAEFDMVINSTSLGMDGKEKLIINLNDLKKSALVCDIVYKPLMTDLLISAQKQGNPIVSGIGMLIYQGVIGFEKWFGIKPQIDQDLINEMINNY